MGGKSVTLHKKYSIPHLRLMTILIGRVNCVRYDLSIFRTDKVNWYSIRLTETSEYTRPLYLHVWMAALNNEVYSCFNKGCPTKV